MMYRINKPIVKAALAARGLKQYNVAQSVGLSDSNFCRVVGGKIRVSSEIVNKMAFALGVPFEDLIIKEEGTQK